VCASKDVWVEQVEGALTIKGENDLNLHTWQASDSGELDLEPSTLVVASPEIGMRDAIKLKQQSDYPILLVENQQLVGILDDSEFYSALTGNFQLNNAA
ncbi:choline ABC transporter ATP-binding protein, partial [Vibrio fortis]